MQPDVKPTAPRGPIRLRYPTLNPFKPPLKKENQSTYDIQFVIESILDFKNHGYWELNPLTETGYQLLEGAIRAERTFRQFGSEDKIPKEEKEDLRPYQNSRRVIVVVGAYSEGKTWLLNNLDKTNLTMAAVPETPGVSVKVTENFLFFDTAGNGVPAAMLHWKKPFALQDKIATEILIRNSTLGIADFYLFVTSHLTSSNQKQILSLVNRLAHSKEGMEGPKVYIAHNLKDIINPLSKQQEFARYLEHIFTRYDGSIMELYKPGNNTSAYETISDEKDWKTMLYKEFAPGLFKKNAPIVIIKSEKKHCVRHFFFLNKDKCSEFNAHSFKLLKSNLSHHGQSNSPYPLLKLKEQLEIELNNMISVKKIPEEMMETFSAPSERIPPPPPFSIVEESGMKDFEWNLNSIAEECIMSSNSAFVPHRTIYRLSSRDPSSTAEFLLIKFDVPGCTIDDVSVVRQGNNGLKISIMKRKDDLSEFGDIQVEDTIKGWISGEERKFSVFPCVFQITLADFDGIRLSHYAPAKTFYFVECGVFSIVLCPTSEDPSCFPSELLEKSKFVDS